MNVYVAAKFEEAPKVREIYKRLADVGIGITHNWTNEDASKFTGKDLENYKRQCAENDYRGVRDADAVLVLNHPLLYGGAAEMGMAIAFGIPVVVVGADIRENIFFHLSYVYKAKDISDAISYLEDRANDGI